MPAYSCVVCSVASIAHLFFTKYFYAFECLDTDDQMISWKVSTFNPIKVWMLFFCFPPTKKDVLHFIIFIETVMESKTNNHWKPGTMENSDGQHHRKPRRPRDFQQIQHTQFSLGKLWGKHTKPTLLIICHLYDKENHSYMIYDLYVTKTVEKMEMVKNSTNRIFFVANVHQNWHPTSDTNPRHKQFHTWRMDQQPQPSSSTKMTSLRARTKKNIVPFTIGSL